MVLRWNRLAGRKIQLRFHNEARNFVVRLTQWHRMAETNYRNSLVDFFFQPVIAADRRFLHDSHLPNHLRLPARRLRSSSIDVDKSGRPGTVVTTDLHGQRIRPRSISFASVRLATCWPSSDAESVTQFRCSDRGTVTTEMESDLTIYVYNIPWIFTVTV